MFVCGDDVEEGLHGSRKNSKSVYSISEEIIEVIDISGDVDFLASCQDMKVYLGHGVCLYGGDDVEEGLHGSRKSSKSVYSISEEIIEDIDISGDNDFLN